ncbi:Biosynthetic Aromatic amino acid aminotransferase alpha / Aspartate aminotransferase [Methanosarcina siciliae C2J]|uniref:Aminotransferase n=3 Tax=Methanosarcina siciliae TaxID=38027 RepID=A0A0E3PB77_9EURY|nr:aminotransferase class I/II-fold pyridoxal phosphate-dependent enzyme [Methanosarcina siciliae]AKB27542.1 Biosynthetic Aromatic amino acid aminotransferase alpha / Aspartate aminotransferase [Methanosarcina siciliae T4/M]AKB31483.1 Biosynthetic Aromatic amino acid aminotransferase alpha / Aspartate aminotransferase [Methanosarcina siciliae HI350]AKB35444.1 Biosynthetic Aromatic amino acid aminotransferase alpha / Aspartate aminotransferase [Methanosarcina siciliae C2J]
MRPPCDPSKFVAEAVKSIPPSGIRRFFDLVSELEDIISLGVGEPDFITPWHIREMCIHSLEKGQTSYTSNYGLPELRDELARTYYKRYGLDYNPGSEILVTTGVSEALDIAIRAVINPGEEVIVVQPSYVAYIPSVILAGGKPVIVSTHRDDDFSLTAEALKPAISSKTKAIVLNFPNNPTGAIMEQEGMEDIADLVVENDLFVISDEVYECLTYGGNHVPFSSLEGMKERTVMLNGFSKAYAMTGLRLGFAMGAQDIIHSMMMIHQYSMLCAPITAQVGAIEALRNGNEEMERMIREYDRRRRFIVKGFNSIGLECCNPRGAFYAFPYVGDTGLSSSDFAERLLQEKKVVTIPGDVFGEAGEGFLRCAYAASLDDIKKAIERMGDFVEELKQ